MSTKLNIKLITDNLADELITRMQHASGVKLLAPHLKLAAERGAEVRMLAGDYLLYNTAGRTFGHSVRSIHELRLNADAEPYTFQMALDKFMQSFYHETTLPVNSDSIELHEEEYRKYHQKNPEMIQRITEMEEAEFGTGLPEETEEEAPELTLVPIQPRFAQLDALEALDSTMEEQYNKAMVVMVTGLGKTYLAGFFAQRFKRILFVAHREEILFQAKKSF